MGKWMRKWDDSLARAKQGLMQAGEKGANLYLSKVNGKAPEGFKLADRGQCEDCDRAWASIDQGMKLVPDVGHGRLMVRQMTLNQINAPLGLANLWRDHCEGCRLNHIQGLLEQPKTPVESH